MQTVARALIIVAAVGLTSVMGCSTLRAVAAAASKSPEKATQKSAKEIAACEKMCSVAGDAEGNAAAIKNCKTKCATK